MIRHHIKTELIAIIAGLAIVSGCSKTIYPSSWQVTPVTVDGSLADRTLPLPYYDTETKLNYSITNDTRNLYICMRTSDRQAQMKMLRAGFTLWLDIKGGKEQKTGIRYPLPQSLLATRGETLVAETHGEKRDIVGMQRHLINEQKQMELIGFMNNANGGNPNGLTFLRTTDGIALAMNIDSTGELVYEATIPFKTFYKEILGPADSLKTISVAMSENGLTMNGNKEHKEESTGGANEGGGGMGMGGGMHGGGGGGHRGGGMHGGGDRSSAGEAKIVWNYVRLTLR